MTYTMFQWEIRQYKIQRFSNHFIRRDMKSYFWKILSLTTISISKPLTL